MAPNLLMALSPRGEKHGGVVGDVLVPKTEQQVCPLNLRGDHIRTIANTGLVASRPPITLF